VIRPWLYIKVIRLFYVKFFVNVALYDKSSYRVLIGNFDWCHFNDFDYILKVISV